METTIWYYKIYLAHTNEKTLLPVFTDNKVFLYLKSMLRYIVQARVILIPYFSLLKTQYTLLALSADTSTLAPNF